MRPSISRASAKVSDSIHRSSGRACSAGAARDVGSRGAPGSTSRIRRPRGGSGDSVAWRPSPDPTGDADPPRLTPTAALDLATVRDFATALLIGALVGTEREKRLSEEAETGIGGIRTFVLIALLG